MIRSPFHPGTFLRRLLEEHGVSQAELARHIGERSSVIGQICNRRRAINAPLAIKLSAALQTSPEFWLNLQSAYELQRAHSTRAIKPIIGVNGRRKPAA
jgi:antitoxin HigA-1